MFLYNSLTRRKEKFVSLEKKNTRMYVCGITPYDTTHLGHAFTYVFFDVLFRYLKHKGYNVIYTQNVTDIDDDILKKAKEIGQNWRELGNFWTRRYLSDMKALNVLPPARFVKATDSIDTMIKIIRTLLKKGFAYKKNGNVYFEVKKDPHYGKLSRLSRNQMLLLSRERGGNPDDPYKRDPIDFLLWQKSSLDEPYWDSPWSKGRPGWHIECSAMIHQYLGDHIDIHGGGRDLIYPHHESEIAQSESFSGLEPFVKYWLHTAMVLCDGEKMAKSLGNLVMVGDLLKKYSANEIRWVLLSHHYRLPWEYDENEFLEARKTLTLLQDVMKQKGGRGEKVKSGTYEKQFIAALEDDLSTPNAEAVLVKIAKRIKHGESNKDISHLAITLKEYLTLLGFSV